MLSLCSHLLLMLAMHSGKMYMSPSFVSMVNFSEHFWYKTNRFHFAGRMYCSRSRKTPQREKKNNFLVV